MSNVRQLYKIPAFPGSFSGVSTVAQHLKSSKKTIDRELRHEETYTRFLPGRNKFKRRQGLVFGANERYELDTMDLRRFAADNMHFKYALVCIDTLTKFLWVRRMKTKSGLETSQNFEEILQEINKTGGFVQTDHGTEFHSEPFQDVCDRWWLKHYSTFTEKRASQAERVIRTLTERLFRYELHVGAFRWTDVIDQFVNNYNLTRHSVTKYAPADVVASKSLQNIVRHRLLDPDKIIQQEPQDKPRVSPGDYVRLPTYRHMLHKRSMAKYTQEIFKVTDYRWINGVHCYWLETLDGELVPGYFTVWQLVKVQPPQ